MPKPTTRSAKTKVTSEEGQTPSEQAVEVHKDTAIHDPNTGSALQQEHLDEATYLDNKHNDDLMDTTDEAPKGEAKQGDDQVTQSQLSDLKMQVLYMAERMLELREAFDSQRVSLTSSPKMNATDVGSKLQQLSQLDNLHSSQRSTGPRRAKQGHPAHKTESEIGFPVSTEGSPRSRHSAATAYRNGDNEDRLLNILEKFAESSRDNSDRTSFNDDKNINYISKHKLLRNKEHAISWLLNLNMLSQQRRWSDKRYCKYLPRLWNPEASITITQFFEDLDRSITQNRLELDKAFIEEFADGGIAQIRHKVIARLQPDTETCSEFLTGIKFALRALEKWQPSAVPEETFIVETLADRFTSARMLQLISHNKRSHKQNCSLAKMYEWCRIADDFEKIERKANPTRILRIRHKMHLLGEEDHRAAHEVIPDIRQVVLNSVNADIDEEYADMLLTMAATEEIYKYNSIPNIRSVVAIREVMKRAPPIATYAVDGVKQKQAICNGPMRHTCVDGEHICPWFALKGQCNITNGKCKHDHKPRQPKMCSFQEGATCPHGAYCANRHKGDEYSIFFWNKNKKRYSEYRWKDRKSTFSQYHK